MIRFLLCAAVVCSVSCRPSLPVPKTVSVENVGELVRAPATTPLGGLERFNLNGTCVGTGEAADVAYSCLTKLTGAQWQITSARRAPTGRASSVSFQQVAANVPVLGAIATVFVDEHRATAIVGTVATQAATTSTAKMTPSQVAATLKEPTLGPPRLVIWPGGPSRLAYYVEFDNVLHDVVLLDPDTGAQLLRYATTVQE